MRQPLYIPAKTKASTPYGASRLGQQDPSGIAHRVWVCRKARMTRDGVLEVAFPDGRTGDPEIRQLIIFRVFLRIRENDQRIEGDSAGLAS